MKYQCTTIANGILVDNGVQVFYYPSLKSAIETLSEEILEEHRQQEHFQWDGKFSLTLGYEPDDD